MPKAEASQLKSLHQMKNLKEQKNKGKVAAIWHSHSRIPAS